MRSFLAADGYDEKLNKEIINVKKELLDEYEDFFRVLIFNTNSGQIIDNYDEKTIYKEFDIKYTNINKSKSDFVVAGKPIWIMGMDETPRSICGDNDVELLIQVKENYIFQKHENAHENIIANRKKIGYDLFIGNRIYFWGNSDKNNPHVYISVQRT